MRDAVLAWFDQRLKVQIPWHQPVVGETSDSRLNDAAGFHVRQEHVWAALDGARSGPVPEGNVGGGTGMSCLGFKGGVGTASRVVDAYTVGVLVQCNFGSRTELTIAGVPVGREMADVPAGPPIDGSREGSIIVVVATDAPLLPHQLERLARRVPMGIARTGGTASNGSGDIFIAFSTANPGAASTGRGPVATHDAAERRYQPVLYRDDSGDGGGDRQRARRRRDDDGREWTHRDGAAARSAPRDSAQVRPPEVIVAACLDSVVVNFGPTT